MASSDVIAGRAVQEIQDKGVGPNGAMLRFRDESGNIASGVDNKGVVQALKGLGYSDGTTTYNSTGNLLPHRAAIDRAWTMIATSGTGVDIPSISAVFPASGAVSYSSVNPAGNGFSSLTPSFSFGSAMAAAVSKQSFDLPSGVYYFPMALSTNAANNSSITAQTVSYNRNPFYFETKFVPRLGNGGAGTFRLIFGLMDTFFGWVSKPVGIWTGTTNSNNFIGFRLVWAGAGTNDLTYKCGCWNQTNGAPGTMIDTGVAPDFNNPHVFSISSDGTTVTFAIDGVSVGTVAVGSANYPVTTSVTLAGIIYQDTNATANANVNDQNGLYVKYVYNAYPNLPVITFP